MDIRGRNELKKRLEAAKNGIEEHIKKVGQQAVEVAKESGSYHDVTGRLRRSNGFRYKDGEAVLFNAAPYAEEVSARGADVLDTATAYLVEELKKPFEI